MGGGPLLFVIISQGLDIIGVILYLYRHASEEYC